MKLVNENQFRVFIDLICIYSVANKSEECALKGAEEIILNIRFCNFTTGNKYVLLVQPHISTLILVTTSVIPKC